MQISAEEFEQDFAAPMRNTPDMPVKYVLLVLIPIAGPCIYFGVLNNFWKKAAQHKKNVCDAFNAKYEKERGVHLEPGMAPKENDSTVFEVEGVVLTVKDPGVLLPGVPTFTPCRNSYLRIYAYQTGKPPLH